MVRISCFILDAIFPAGCKSVVIMFGIFDDQCKVCFPFYRRL